MSTKTRQTKKTKATEAQAPADQSKLEPTSSPTNLYTDDELRRILDAIEAYRRIKKQYTRQRDDYLKVIGPALLIARAGALKVAGTINVRSQAYRDAMGEELKRTGLDVIDKGTRSYLLKLMDCLSELEAWLVKQTNLDRLNHPKTIWKAFEPSLGYAPHCFPWADEPGVDKEDEEEYLGGWWLDDEDSGDDDEDSAGDDSGDDDEDSAGDDSGDDEDSGDDSGDDEDSGDEIDPEALKMHFGEPRTIGELKEYIEEAIRRGAKLDNRFHIKNNDDESDLYDSVYAYFLDDESTPDYHAPAFMVLVGIEEGGDGNSVLRQRITNLESKLAKAVADRERLYSENANLQLINRAGLGNLNRAISGISA
jgi:hypothetical protein